MYCAIDMLSDCSERVPYNNPDFPVFVGKGYLSVYRDMRCACHWHNDFEFGIVLSGCMSYSINGEVHQLSSGQGIFINARQLHNNFSMDGSDCEYICVLIHPSLLCANSYLNDTYISPIISNDAFQYMILYRSSWQAELMDAILSIESIYSCEDKALGLKIQSLSNQIISLLYEKMPDAKTLSPCVDPRLSSLRNMVGFIQRHYSEKIGLKQIAEAGNIGISSCCDIFKQQLNQSPIGYLTRYRLEKSIELMTNPSLSMTEIAMENGFSNSSYYAETFRKHIGIPPTQYRKQNL